MPELSQSLNVSPPLQGLWDQYLLPEALAGTDPALVTAGEVVGFATGFVPGQPVTIEGLALLAAIYAGASRPVWSTPVTKTLAGDGTPVTFNGFGIAAAGPREGNPPAISVVDLSARFFDAGGEITGYELTPELPDGVDNVGPQIGGIPVGFNTDQLYIGVRLCMSNTNTEQKVIPVTVSVDTDTPADEVLCYFTSISQPLHRGIDLG